MFQGEQEWSIAWRTDGEPGRSAGLAAILMRAMSRPSSFDARLADLQEGDVDLGERAALSVLKRNGLTAPAQEQAFRGGVRDDAQARARQGQAVDLTHPFHGALDPSGFDRPAVALDRRREIGQVGRGMVLADEDERADRDPGNANGRVERVSRLGLGGGRPPPSAFEAEDGEGRRPQSPHSANRRDNS